MVRNSSRNGVNLRKNLPTVLSHFRWECYRKGPLYQLYSHKPIVNPGKVLTRAEVIEKAKKEFSEKFSNNPNKNKMLVILLTALNLKLNYIKYDEFFPGNEIPWINRDGETASYSFFSASPDEKKIQITVQNFLKSLPGVDIAEYKGTINKSCLSEPTQADNFDDPHFINVDAFRDIIKKDTSMKAAVETLNTSSKTGIIEEENTPLNLDDVPLDDKTAVKQLKLAAKQGSADAQCALAYRLANGRGITKNEKKAVELYQLAANQGHILAHYNLGYMLENGCGITKDLEAAVKQYQLAAAQGHTQAHFNLGYMLENGYGIKKDLETAVKQYQLAAAQGHAQAHFNLGYMLENGIGITKDKIEARKEFELAAEQLKPLRASINKLKEYSESLTKSNNLEACSAGKAGIQLAVTLNTILDKNPRGDTLKTEGSLFQVALEKGYQEMSEHRRLGLFHSFLIAIASVLSTIKSCFSKADSIGKSNIKIGQISAGFFARTTRQGIVTDIKKELDT